MSKVLFSNNTQDTSYLRGASWIQPQDLKIGQAWLVSINEYESKIAREDEQLQTTLPGVTSLKSLRM